MKTFFFFLAWTTFPLGAELPQAVFEAQTIDDGIQVGYGLAIADVDGDGREDILLVDAGETVWYRNPDWQKERLTGALTERDHVCLCAHDLDGDSRAEVAVGAEWNPGDTVNSGAVFALSRPTEGGGLWDARPLHHEPTVHRMHWVREAAGHFLAVLPLHGCGNRGGEGEGIRFLGYRPQEKGRDWPTFLIHQGFHLAHNFDPVAWGDQAQESLLVACKEGVHLLQGQDEDWEATALTEKGAGEVRLGRGPGGQRFVATIEPMHGHEVVINPENVDGLWSQQRQVIDADLGEGHALVVGDFLALGYDQVVAGWRKPSRREGKVGLRLYAAGRSPGDPWRQHAIIDDNGMACEDAKAADLNGDGKLDIIAAGRATRNVVIYWNRSGEDS
ncbi:FG-GAP repeat domain-containing protein [Roseibacillus ishigakijimensis]|uniref:VCBS repeat-containing protein n=1 Tax=Roseibacillus ishigakijimensis TaxID=454146 RepID=A0A934RPR6_9BACT|nr:VCBS repeat-containing protein [Roseibacillus ishigakijimensis]MBK1833233.1 VCBS repeat-containing protein [Roseibacillus ishigakijimensis]